MVRFASTSPTERAAKSGQSQRSVAVASTATQNAGYSRLIREATNCRGVRPHTDIRITKPLMVKNRCTPA